MKTINSKLITQTIMFGITLICAVIICISIFQILNGSENEVSSIFDRM